MTLERTPDPGFNNSPNQFDDIWGGKDVKIDVMPDRKMVKEFIEDNRGYIKGAAVLIPLTLASCGGSYSQNVDIDTKLPVLAGCISGSFFAAEELFDRNSDKNFGRRVLSFALNGAAGFTAGYSLANNLHDNESWLSNQKLIETSALPLSVYVMAREGSLKYYRELVGNFFKSNVDKISENRQIREQEFMNKKMEKSSKERTSIYKAARHLQDAGFSGHELYEQLKSEGWKDKDITNFIHVS